MAHRVAEFPRGGSLAPGVEADAAVPGAATSSPAGAEARRESSSPLHAGPLSELEKALQGRKATIDRYHFLLLLRFAVVNLVGIALLGAAYMQGWVDKVLAGDETRMVLLIFGLFVIGLALSAWKISRTSRELNSIKSYDPLSPSRVAGYLSAVRTRSGESRAISAESLKLKMSNRISVVRHIANTLVLLGLIGTVVGFIIALSGVDPAVAADVKVIGPMVSTLIGGMSVALYTTLVGAVFNIWLMVNYRLLLSGTVNLVTAIVELGEKYARD